MKKYYRNEDNYFDGLWLIYNCKDYNFVNSSSTPFWAYTSSFYGDENTMSVRYANCALSFLCDDSNEGFDAHTLIHETGHILRLDDCYSYENYYNYGYLGGVDMMDLNISDHSTFSKYALGRTKPTIVYEKESTFKLKPFAESGDTIIIPSSYFNNSAFNVYLILEYKSPTGLNKLDYDNKYCDEGTEI